MAKAAIVSYFRGPYKARRASYCAPPAQGDRISPLKRRIKVSIPDQHFAEIQWMASDSGLTFSGILTEILNDWFTRPLEPD